MSTYPKVRAEISRSALENNYELMKKLTGKPQICVVKADCYGHGIECAGIFYDCGCRAFAVSGTGEALLLREFFNKRNERPEILILGYVNPKDVPELIDNDVIAAMFSDEYAKLCRDNVPSGKRLRVHIKINTGMNRIGFDKDLTDEAADVCRMTCFSVEGAFTHFACADEEDEAPTIYQKTLFDAAVDKLRKSGAELKLIHAYNSAASLRFKPEYDAVRSGVVLYGMAPSDVVTHGGLQPVMSLKTDVAQVRTLHKGDRVSYGWEFEAPETMKTATLPIGYADGYIRAYRGGYALIQGKKAPIIGRICMDQLMVDVSEIDNVKCGDEAVMLGDGGISADELAALAGTINYEVTCLVSKRVRRILI